MGTLNFNGDGRRCDYCGTAGDRLVVVTPTEEIIVRDANLEALVCQLVSSGSDVRDLLIYKALMALANDLFEGACPNADRVPDDVMAFTKSLGAIADLVRTGKGTDWAAISAAMQQEAR